MATDGNNNTNLPARRLSSEQLEAVIRRAVELQAQGSDAPDGVDEAEVVRIGTELGLAPEHVRRAVAEVRGRGEPEEGTLARYFGRGRATAGRVVGLPAERVAAELERYLLDCEHMVVQRRRLPVTVYERGSGFAATLARTAQQFSDKTPRLDVRELETVVEPVEEGRSFVALAADLSSQRNGRFAGALAAGLGGGGAVAAAVLVAVPWMLPLALLGVPVFAGTYWGMSAAHAATVRKTETRLHSILDRLESGELLPRKLLGKTPAQMLGLDR